MQSVFIHSQWIRLSTVPFLAYPLSVDKSFHTKQIPSLFLNIFPLRLIYYCVVTNSLGSSSKSVQSPRITYKVTEHIDALEPVISQQLENVSLDFGKPFKLSISAFAKDDGSLSYQWYFASSVDLEAQAINGKTDSTIEGVVGSDTVGYYYCVVTNTISDNGDGGVKSVCVKSDTVGFETVYISDAIQTTFTKQPKALSIAPLNTSISLSVEAEAQGCDVSYKWYETTSEDKATSVEISGAESDSITIPAPNEKGSRYYYCVATAIPKESDGIKAVISAISDVATVVCTALPAVYVDTADKVAITSKEDWLKNSTISIKGSSYDIENVKMSIRGRGNSTWAQPKKPYAIKIVNSFVNSL